MDNRIPFRLRTLPMMVASFFANMLVGVFNQVVGLILCNRQNNWVKTEHHVTRSEAYNVEGRRTARQQEAM